MSIKHCQKHGTQIQRILLYSKLRYLTYLNWPNTSILFIRSICCRSINISVIRNVYVQLNYCCKEWRKYGNVFSMLHIFVLSLILSKPLVVSLIISIRYIVEIMNIPVLLCCCVIHHCTSCTRIKIPDESIIVLLFCSWEKLIT